MLPVLLKPDAEPPFVYDGKVYTESDTHKITLKCIKPKFQVEYSVPALSSLYFVKEKLLSDEKLKLDLKVGAIKFLSKGKVLNDTVSVLDIGESLTVMVQSPEEDIDVPIQPQVYWSEKPKPVQVKNDVKKDALPGINDKFWKEVEVIAVRYVEDPKALVDQLRSTYELD